jgi:GntR family transcriptional regulator, transcriptional repressor for pyruvate dehydrogenase complex
MGGVALRVVARVSVADQVYEQILGDVVSGEFAAGEALPSERRLAEVFAVSRPVIREALQRLAQAGLVEVRQGDATKVRDFRHHGGLDLLPHLLGRGGTLDVAVVRSVLEARLHVGPQVAALAAERSGHRLATALRDAVHAVKTAADPVAAQRHALVFWDHVVDGADSIAFRLMFNSLRAAYEPSLAALATVMAPEVGRPQAYRRLADAILAGDPDAARDAAEELLRPATAAFLTAIRRLEEGS